MPLLIPIRQVVYDLAQLNKEDVMRNLRLTIVGRCKLGEKNRGFIFTAEPIAPVLSDWDWQMFPDDTGRVFRRDGLPNVDTKCLPAITLDELRHIDKKSRHPIIDGHMQTVVDDELDTPMMAFMVTSADIEEIMGDPYRRSILEFFDETYEATQARVDDSHV